jgi:general secretion pathway protein B
MSYILEALKKAQAERARGAVPGVDAQPVPTMAPRAPASLWLWPTGALAALALAAVLFWPASDRERPIASVEPTPPVAMRAGESAVRPPAPASTPAAPTPAAPASPASTTAVAAAPAPAPAAAPEPPARPARKMGDTASAANATPAPAPAPAPAPERIALLQELPAQIQREIPPIAINGYLYASKPADRSVLINNRLRREGDQLADGLTLEKLLPSEMVLNYRGYRYRVSY